MPSSTDHDDPLTRAMRAPTNESPADKAARMQAETEATKRSQLIDAQLRAERVQMKKENDKQHKVLLVGECHWHQGSNLVKRKYLNLKIGQAESGKTTVIKSVFYCL